MNTLTTTAMKKLFLLTFLLIPFLSFSQFGTKELYGYSRIGIGVGFSQISYKTNLEGNKQGVPLIVSANLGGGMTTEVGFGFKFMENVYIEPFVSYMFSSQQFHNVGTKVYKLSTNRFNIGVNGKYFVYVNSEFNLEFYGGTSFRIPQDMVVETENGIEHISFHSNIGVHGGFGGNYIKGNFVFNTGLRYRYEKYKLNTERELPSQFITLNSDLTTMKIKGIDIVFSVMYNF